MREPEVDRLSSKREKIRPKVTELRVVGSNPGSGSSISVGQTRTNLYLHKRIRNLIPF